MCRAYDPRGTRFQASLDEWWADYQPPDDLHQQERDLTAAIQTAATTAIPMCTPSRRHQTDWWYYNDEVREHNHRVNLHRKLYKKRPNPSNLRLLQEVVARAWQVSLRAKEDKWLEWCATFSQHTSLGQMWRSVRTASGAAPPRPAAHPHPQQEAERLATTFTSRGSSDQLPLHTRRTQQQLQPHRDEAIREAMEVADMTDRPFSLQELQQAKRRGRDTATGADGVPYSMLAHAGPAGDTALMPFGLKNSAQTFQRFIDEVLRGLPFCFAYVDDVLIASPNEETHQQHLTQVCKKISTGVHSRDITDRLTPPTGSLLLPELGLPPCCLPPERSTWRNQQGRKTVDPLLPELPSQQDQQTHQVVSSNLLTTLCQV
ncbi:hypothetical protein Pcinc_010371 [Petrolisthes cinctipes]|uniref:Reverse transcriptase domain-containing protein n=1 Tax=Petrolisthes cinctipes TaxID=88211 RepID=A0AAE1KVH1_PETCI|nr:hypothetical protein Pcinc_010371 [Petrolisthes cinctipes]